VLPVTFKISCVTWWCVFSSHMRFSASIPSPRGLVIVIISPRSDTCNFHLAAYLYTSYLFVYSIYVIEILHFSVPLCLRMPSYNYLLDDLEGHYRTRRYSPAGALTLVQPVVKANSLPRWADRAYFHCSLSPLYRLVEISRPISLCRYSQHDLSASGFGAALAVLVGCHLAVVVLVVAGSSSGAVCGGSVG
jgi:hypothetical protein